MMRAFVWFTAVFMCMAPLAAEIVLNSPNGGEPMTLGQPWMIAWTAPNVTQDVKIVLLKSDNSKFELIKANLKPGSSPYSWTIGQTVAGMAPPGSYKIRVATMDNAQQDVSAGVFAIAAGKPSLELTSPNGKKDLVKLSKHAITWKAVNFDGAVDLVLKQNDSTIGTIATKLPAKQGSHPWSVGALLDGKSAGSGAGYRVRLVKNYEGLYRPAGSPEFADESDNPFSIVNIQQKTSAIKIVDLGITRPVMRPNLVVCNVAPGQLSEKHMDPHNPGFANFNFAARICNTGKADSKSCWIKVVFDGGAGESRVIPTIKAGECITEIFIIHTQLDDSLSVSYTVWIDEMKQVDELEESDNCLDGVVSATTVVYARCSDGKDHFPTN